MSIRAYRINEIKTSASPTFNLWHDDELLNFLQENNILNSLDDDMCGIIDIPVTILEKAVKTLKLNKELKQAIKDDIKWAKENELEYIQYYCY